MSLMTLLRYLVGNREAILRIASSRSALGVGMLFVFSAALAREYDSQDLLHDPWYLALPMGASLLTSFLLFCLVSLIALARSERRQPFSPAYWQFLTLYWMTAPIAWLYALPFDRFLSAEDATAANLALLGLVSVWRVALMTRVVSVFFGASVVAAFWIVMLFADTVALVILYFTPLPVFNIMGGIPLTRSELLIQEAALWVGVLGFLSWWIWLVGTAIIAALKRDWAPPDFNSTAPMRITPSLWCFAIASILVWALVLSKTQREQRLRHDVEHRFARGEITEPLAIMSRHQPEDFPPHWLPPPWLGYENPKPSLLKVVDAAINEPTAPWVREIYVQKLLSKFDDPWAYDYEWQNSSPEYNSRLLTLIEQIPPSKNVADRLRRILTIEKNKDLRDRIDAILKRADEQFPKATDTLQ